ncbi:MAG TPA: energy transducer TonB [Chthoniobacterales bacterium]|nr:energy transducer TonB [Chthoniobacterales bacterium]
MTTLLYQPGKKWSFGVALGAAVIIHFAAIGLAKVRNAERPAAPEPPGFTEISFADPAAPDDPAPNDIEPLPALPIVDATYFEQTFTPPPRPSVHPWTPIPRSRSNPTPRSLNLSSAKVLALNAPRPEYPYEARRQKITGDGIAILTIDSNSGNVIDVTMSKSTGNSFLDNAAVAGFKRWRFKPGTVSSVTCPVTFTLTGASY